jgi:hypothetical protein
MRTVSAGLLLCVSAGCYARAPDHETVDAAYLSAQHIPSAGNLVAAQRVLDQDGEHVLVLTRKAGPSPAAPQSGRVEHIELDAVYYAKQGGAWKPAWTVHDFVDCPGLDAAAEFFTSAVSVTDINGDGKAEVTVPYKLLCGGGIDPYTVKVILREGQLKLAIRGESDLKLPGQEPMPGARQYDKALQTQRYSAYKKHMDQVWRTVSPDLRR